MIKEMANKPVRQIYRFGLAVAVRKQGWILVASWLMLLTFIINYLPLLVRSVELNIYVFQPLFWLSLGYLAYRLWHLEDAAASITVDRWLVWVAVLVGIFQVSVFILAGVLAGFGHSPYGHQFRLIILNIWFVGTRLIGLEIARWYLVSALKRRNVILSVSFTWLLFVLAEMPVTRLWSTSFNQVEEVFHLFGNVVLPVASQNVLATYLVLVGGPFASLAYRGVLAAFEWLSPILPNLKWTMNAFLGTIIPILGVIFARDLIDWRNARRGGQEEAKEESWGTGWVLVSVFMVFLLWFNSGLFGVRPTLISGISMEPNIKSGDIVITRSVTPAEVKRGDIVLFHEGQHEILHRVIDIQKDQGTMVFTTKGDNVSIPDKPWTENDLAGKLVLVIPKLGWISIGMKLLIDRLF